MQKNTYRRFLLFFICFMLATIISACQMFQRTSPEEAVRLRIEGHMNTKISKNWTKAYADFDSEYHDTVSQKQYERKMSKFEYKGFNIDSIEIDPSGEKATAIVKVDVSMMGFDFKGNSETQIWVREKWNWYMHVPPKDPKEVFK